jgi:hypothetical protein
MREVSSLEPGVQLAVAIMLLALIMYFHSRCCLQQTLPTYGFAKMYSGVNTQSFQKHITSQELTAEGLRLLGPTVIRLAEVEGLDAHAESIRVRLQELGVEM